MTIQSEGSVHKGAIIHLMFRRLFLFAALSAISCIGHPEAQVKRIPPLGASASATPSEAPQLTKKGLQSNSPTERNPFRNLSKNNVSPANVARLLRQNPRADSQPLWLALGLSPWQFDRDPSVMVISIDFTPG